MTKDRIIRTLKEMADLLEIEGAGSFEVMAYRAGMRSVDDFEGDLEEAAAAGMLTAIDGIGKGLSKVITELVQAGRSSEHEEIKARFPPGLPELLELRGIGPKKVQRLWTELEVTNLDELEQAARAQAVSALRGFGKKTEENILASITWRRERAGKRKQAPSVKRAAPTRRRAVSTAAAGHLIPGTSGYAYKEWKGAFYPEDLAASRFLTYYAGRFGTVELNNSFYRFPTEAGLERWAAQTPDDFLFAVKANQRITHRLRLKSTQDVVTSFVERCTTLGRRLGPILFQLPPNLERDDGLLDGFLACLPPGGRYAIEFRHETWVDDAVFTRLADKNVALVVHDGEALAMPREATAPFVYVRLRQGDYDEAALDSWSAWFETLVAEKRDVFVYLKHKADTSPEAVLGRWREAPATRDRIMATSATKRREPARRKRNA